MYTMQPPQSPRCAGFVGLRLTRVTAAPVVSRAVRLIERCWLGLCFPIWPQFVSNALLHCNISEPHTRISP